MKFIYLGHKLLNNISKLNINKFNLAHTNSNIRVRFAPSPTGKLHIGGLRTAFYNYLFARKHNGEFILRIEDTDQERLVKDSLNNIVESLKWAGLEPDLGPGFNKSNANEIEAGGPWMQSQRLHIYAQHAKVLLEQKKAYRCFCDETRLALLKRNAAKRLEKIGYDGKCRHLDDETINNYLNENKPFVIRFKLEDKEVFFEDLTTGMHKSNPCKQEGDFIIIKSDKFPTYHFANVVDDHLMKITHVFRGQEWQISTAKHILLYEAFGWKHPVFSHLPLICNNDGSKISKRQNDIDVLSYRERGYFPEALLAYLSTIGGGSKVNVFDSDWFFTNGKSVLTNLIENFDETKMNAKMIKLNPELMDNLNKRILQLKLNNQQESKLIVDTLREIVIKKYETNSNLNTFYLSDAYLNTVLKWSQDRINKLKDLVENVEFAFLWTDMTNLDLKELNLIKEQLLKFIESFENFLLNSDERLLKDQSSIKKEMNSLFKQLKLESKSESEKKLNYWQLIRLVLTGNLKGPSVVELFQILGKENIIFRLDIAKKICLKM